MPCINFCKMPEGLRKFGPYVRRALLLLALAGILSGCIGDKQDAYDQETGTSSAVSKEPQNTTGLLPTPTLAANPDGSLSTQPNYVEALPTPYIYPSQQQIEATKGVEVIEEKSDRFTSYPGEGFRQAMHRVAQTPDINGNLTFRIYSQTRRSVLYRPARYDLPPVLASGELGLMSLNTLTLPDVLEQIRIRSTEDSRLTQLHNALTAEATANTYFPGILTPEQTAAIGSAGYHIRTKDIGVPEAGYKDVYEVTILDTNGNPIFYMRYGKVEGQGHYGIHKPLDIQIFPPQSSIDWDKITKDTQPHLNKVSTRPNTQFADNRPTSANSLFQVNALT